MTTNTCAGCAFWAGDASRARADCALNQRSKPWSYQEACGRWKLSIEAAPPAPEAPKLAMQSQVRGTVTP